MLLIFVQGHPKLEQDNLCFDFGAGCVSRLSGDCKEIVSTWTLTDCG